MIKYDKYKNGACLKFISRMLVWKIEQQWNLRSVGNEDTCEFRTGGKKGSVRRWKTY